MDRPRENVDFLLASTTSQAKSLGSQRTLSTPEQTKCGKIIEGIRLLNGTRNNKSVQRRSKSLLIVISVLGRQDKTLFTPRFSRFGW